MQIIYRPE